MIKVVGTDFGTRLKVLKAKNTIIRTFDLVPKKNLQLFSLAQKLKTIIKTLYLVPKTVKNY